MSSDDQSPSPPGGPKFDVTLSDGASAGIVGDHGVIGAFYAVTPRREVSWPVVVGSAPPLASAFQHRDLAGGGVGGSAGGEAGSPDTVVLRQVLSGDGGVGKTQIAAGMFALSEAELRVWLSAESRAAVLTGYAQAALRLDLADADAGVEFLAGCFLGFLAAPGRSWLVVLDDLQDPADLTDLWPPTTDQGLVVVTTRRRDAVLTGGGRRVVDVGVYTPEEALLYLTERLTPFLGRLPVSALNEAEKLGTELGLLPLALSHAAAVIIDEAIAVAEYREWFAGRRRALAELFPPGADADGYGRTVAATWDLAVQAADRLEPVGLSRPMAQLIAVMDPTGVPETVLTGSAAREWLSASAPGAHVNTSAGRQSLRNLDRLSLVSHQPGAGVPRAVRMHGLTGRAVLQGLTDEEVAAVVRTAADALRGAWPAIENQPALSEALRANVDAISLVAEDALWDPDSGGHLVLFKAGSSLTEAGLARAAITYHESLASTAMTRLGPDHADTLLSWNYLASAYQDAGDLRRSVPLYEETLASHERVLGADHPYTLSARNNLSGAYLAAGDPGRATPLLEQTLADRERVLGAHHADTLSSRNNLAYAYDAARDLGRAIPLYQQTLDDVQRLLGADHPQALMLRNNLASAYESAGDLDRAVPLYEDTLRDRERVLGPDHPETLNSRNNLAYAYRAAGDLERAVQLYERTLADRERLLGPDHPHTLASRNNLAHAYLWVGAQGRAIPLFERTLADRERLLGPDHPHTLASRNNLAHAYESARDLPVVVPLHEQTLTDMERDRLGP